MDHELYKKGRELSREQFPHITERLQNFLLFLIMAFTTSLKEETAKQRYEHRCSHCIILSAVGYKILQQNKAGPSLSHHT